MTDIVERLRENSKLEWDYTMDLQEEAAVEIEALRKDNARLDELMSAIAMEWVKMPHPPRGQVPSALDMAIMRAADFTTGLHRAKQGSAGDD